MGINLLKYPISGRTSGMDGRVWRQARFFQHQAGEDYFFLKDQPAHLGVTGRFPFNKQAKSKRKKPLHSLLMRSVEAFVFGLAGEYRAAMAS